MWGFVGAYLYEKLPLAMSVLFSKATSCCRKGLTLEARWIVIVFRLASPSLSPFVNLISFLYFEGLATTKKTPKPAFSPT